MFSDLANIKKIIKQEGFKRFDRLEAVALVY